MFAFYWQSAYGGPIIIISLIAPGFLDNTVHAYECRDYVSASMMSVLLTAC